MTVGEIKFIDLPLGPYHRDLVREWFVMHMEDRRGEGPEIRRIGY